MANPEITNPVKEDRMSMLMRRRHQRLGIIMNQRTLCRSHNTTISTQRPLPLSKSISNATIVNRANRVSHVNIASRVNHGNNNRPENLAAMTLPMRRHRIAMNRLKRIAC
jgi:hypothetical protein